MAIEQRSNHGGIFGAASRVALLKVLRVYAIIYVCACAFLIAVRLLP